MPRTNGFTLVEMMVVLTIALILGALAYPSYASYMTRLRRIEAQTALLQTMQDQERYYTQHNVYLPFSADSDDPDARHFHWWLGSEPARSAYELSGRACVNLPLTACIELRAIPGTGRVDSRFRDPACETLTLTNSGEHGASGRMARCWP